MPGEILEVYSSADQVGQDLGQATFLPFEEDHSQRVGPEVPREDHSNSRQQVSLDHIPLESEVEEKHGTNMLFSDVFIEIYRDSMLSERKRIARINYNLFFLNKDTLEINFSSKNIKLEKNNLEDFDITFHFQFFCLCHLSNYHNTKCQCSLIRTHEQMFWAQSIAEIS